MFVGNSLSSKRIERVAEYNDIPVGVCEFYKKEFESYFEMDKYIEAFEKASADGRWKDSVIRYLDNWVVQLATNQHEIYTGEYELRPLREFPVIRRGTLRHIRAVSFEDGINGHCVCDNFLTDHLTRSFIRENGACIKGRGVNFCMKVLKSDMTQMYAEHRTNYYVLTMDIRHFFDTIDHKYIKKVIKRHIKNPYTREYLYNIVDIFKGEVGLGLGSQVTQLLASLDLNEMDHFIKEKLQCEHYCRYADDFYILHESREYLEWCREQIELHLAVIGLSLHKKKTKIFRVNTQPITFLGFKYFHSNTGRVMVEVRQETIKRAKTKLKKLARKYHNGELPLSAGLQCYSAYKGHICKGNIKSPLKGLNDYFTKIFGVSPRVKFIRNFRWKKVQNKNTGKWKWKKKTYIKVVLKPMYK